MEILVALLLTAFGLSTLHAQEKKDLDGVPAKLEWTNPDKKETFPEQPATAAPPVTGTTSAQTTPQNPLPIAEVASPGDKPTPTTPVETATSSDKTNSKKLFGPGITEKSKESFGQPDLQISMWKYIMSMLIVLALIGIFFWGLKRFSIKLGGSGFGVLMVTNRVQLDGRNSLFVVKYHEEELLVAVGPNGPSLMSKTAALETATEEDEEEDASGSKPSTSNMETTHVPPSASKLLSKFLIHQPKKGGGA